MLAYAGGSVLTIWRRSSVARASSQEGLQALIDAEASTTNTVRIAELGLSATPFVMAPTPTGLPGEYKRLPTIAGEAVSVSVLHMVATDDAAETYTVTGVGLFLDNGDLFGVFSQGAGDGPLLKRARRRRFSLLLMLLLRPATPR